MSLHQLPASHQYGPITVTGGVAQLGDQYVTIHHDEEYKRERQWQQLLTSLRFGEINSRYQEIKDSQYETYEWIFHLPEKHGPQQSGLVTWLKEEHGVYLIQGKAGSGKSTFMKFLFEHHQTKTLLQEWHPTRTCVILFHSFWLVGTKLQHSFKGLLANLVSQIARTHPEIVAQSCMQHLRKAYLDDWSEKELRQVLLQCIQDPALSGCIFLDGMDEFDHNDDIERLFKVINDIEETSRAAWKLCISTRPIQYILDRSKPAPTMKLHELTAADIETYAATTLKETGQVARYTEDELERLAYVIREKANGVFLWVHYAVRSVCNGLRIEDEYHDLCRRLETLPSAIEDLYRQMWQTQNADNAIHTKESQLLFELGTLLHDQAWSIIHAGLCFPLPLFQLLLAFNSPLRAEYLASLETLDEEHLTNLCLGFSKKISSRSAGLIECVLVDDNWYYAYDARSTRDLIGSKYNVIVESKSLWRRSNVQFIHRTVLDFLKNTSEGRLIAGLADGPHKKPVRALLEARLVCLIEGVLPFCIEFLVSLSKLMDAIEAEDVDFIDLFDRTITRILHKRLGLGIPTTAAWIQLNKCYRTTSGLSVAYAECRDFQGLVMSSVSSVLCAEYIIATQGGQWSSYYKGHLFLQVFYTGWGWHTDGDVPNPNQLKIMAPWHNSGADLITPQVSCRYGLHPIIRSPATEVLCNLVTKILFTRTDLSCPSSEITAWNNLLNTYIRDTRMDGDITFVSRPRDISNLLQNLVQNETCLLITVSANQLREAVCDILDRTKQKHPRHKMRKVFLALIKQLHVYRGIDTTKSDQEDLNCISHSQYGIVKCNAEEMVHFKELIIPVPEDDNRGTKIQVAVNKIDRARFTGVGHPDCPMFPDIDMSFPSEKVIMHPLDPCQDIGPHNWRTEATKRECFDGSWYPDFGAGDQHTSEPHDLTSPHRRDSAAAATTPEVVQRTEKGKDTSIDYHQCDACRLHDSVD